MASESEGMFVRDARTPRDANHRAAAKPGELRSLNSEDVSPRPESGPRQENVLDADESGDKTFFAGAQWHGPYAEALLKADPATVTARIERAELVMTIRYLELCKTPTDTNEVVELQNAAYTLSQISRTNEICASGQPPPA